MLNVSSINSYSFKPYVAKKQAETLPKTDIFNSSIPDKKISRDNYFAYSPSFTAIGRKKADKNVNEIPSIQEQYKVVKSKLDRKSLSQFQSLDNKGILTNNNSNDGSTVLENLYKISSRPRIQGLSSSRILSEVISALDNPYTITQKFGDIPKNVADEIAQETGTAFPEQAYNVNSSSCVVASMEFNLASKKPAEFARFAEGLSGNNYSVDKKVNMEAFSIGTADCLWKLREFNTDSYLENNWENAVIKIKPDRNAIVRARVQATYKDPGERSSVDVLIQSALLNLGSQHTYNALTDERTGKFNPDNTGLTDMEKTFVEQVVFETPKIPVVYQNIDENGHLAGYNCNPEETKQHILKSLELGQNVIIGYTHMDNNKNVHGGHEITIVGYRQDENNKGYFICNDTDDGIDVPIEVPEDQLLPLIHHAGISKDALGPDDVILEPWKEILESVKPIIQGN